MLEAELCGEALDRHCLDRIATGLESIPVLEGTPTSDALEESLPTNLL